LSAPVRSHLSGRRLLEAITLLHGRGYERLRIVPHLVRAGLFWRCTLTTRDRISSRHGALPGRVSGSPSYDEYHYSSASLDDYFDTGTPIASAEALADAIETRFVALCAAARGEDPAYKAWFTLMLDASAPLGLPWAFDDFASVAGPDDPLPIAGGPLRAIPPPPPGDAEPL
jgi:hypothetical protein